jgi:hypothetical protein
VRQAGVRQCRVQFGMARQGFIPSCMTVFMISGRARSNPSRSAQVRWGSVFHGLVWFTLIGTRYGTLRQGLIGFDMAR